MKRAFERRPKETGQATSKLPAAVLPRDSSWLDLQNESPSSEHLGWTHCQFPITVQRFLATVFGIVFVVLLGATAARVVKGHQIPGPFDPARQGFCDFQNGIYFPSLAFSRGLSPYGEEYNANYPVARSIPFFSPVILALHVPWSWLELHVAEVGYFSWMVLLLIVTAYLITLWCTSDLSLQGASRSAWNWRSNIRSDWWRWDLFMLVACATVVSRSGQQTLFTGYFTFEIVLASLIAVHYAAKYPWLAALALVVVSGKPNFVLPIGLLMLSRGNWKALMAGGVLSAGLAFLAFLWILPEGGFPELLAQIEQTQANHRGDAIERPVNNWMRVDLLAVVAKWTEQDPAESVYLAVMALIIAPVAWLLHSYHRLINCSGQSDSGTTTGISGATVLLVSIIAVYHAVYDTLLVLPVIFALLLANDTVWRRYSIAFRWILVGLLSVPAMNYLSSQKFLLRYGIEGDLHKLVTSINAIAFTMAAGMFVYVLIEEIRRLKLSTKPNCTSDPSRAASAATEAG